jgi:LysM repeat protein
MRRFGRFLMLVPLIVGFGLISAGPGSWGWDRVSADTYEVQAGDNLSGIASCLNVSESVLLRLNTSITSPDEIFAGQRIEIPANAQPQGCGSGVSTPETSRLATQLHHQGGQCTYVVQDGEYLGAIAEAVGSDTPTILALNSLANPNLIHSGSKLQVPCAASTGDQPSHTQTSLALTAGIQTDGRGLGGTRLEEYTVKQDEWATDIAERFGVSLELLQEYNPLLDLNRIHPGDMLYIPIPDYLAPALPPSEALGALTMTYTVRPSDSDGAGAIATRFGISLAELRQLNGGASLNLIRIGQSLTVPWTGVATHSAPGTVPAVEVRRRTHQVQADDTLSSVAARFGLSLDELRAQNPLKPSDLLVIGERLFLPGTIDPRIVAEDRTLWDADVVQYAAAKLGVTPHTLLTNHDWVDSGQWLEAGTNWRLPLREGVLITVQRGDTLQGIANAHGVDIDLILADPANGVDDPNMIVIGQEIILPLAMPDFAWPARGVLTDPFGQCRSWDCSYRHRGLDMALDIYEPIVAAADGVVTFVGGDSSFGLGWYVEVDHGDGWSTTYAHLVEFNVYEGEEVGQGDVIGYNGNTGYSTGPHLHFEVHHNDWFVDPMVVLP